MPKQSSTPPRTPTSALPWAGHTANPPSSRPIRDRPPPAGPSWGSTSVPKSVSVIWALSPRYQQDRILQLHHDAVNATMDWLEIFFLPPPAGGNGVRA